MKYAEIYILLLIPALLIAGIFLYAGAAQRKKRLLFKLLGNRANDPEALHLSRRRRHWKFFFLMAGMVAIICGAARPYWKEKALPFKQTGRDIMVIFDVSKSMRATDLPPSRLEHAKYLLREVIDSSPGDRFGLIAFAGNAFLSCPLTADPEALKEYINELDTSVVPEGGTNIERALRTADRALTAAEGNHCAVLMLTDGEALSGNAVRYLERFKAKKIPLIIAGMGDPAVAAPVPDGKGGFIRDRNGTPAASRLDEESLKKFASSTDGMYLRSTVGNTGAAAIVQQLKKLDSVERKSAVSRQIEDEFTWFFAAGFILLLCSALLSEVPGKIRAGLVLISVLTLTASAAEKVPETREALPGNPLQLYNLARSRQEKGDASALPLYEEVIKKSAGNVELQSRALHNLAVAHHLESRKAFTVAQQQFSGQQLDPALKELQRSRSVMEQAAELYRQALAKNSSIASGAAVNLRQLELDIKQLEKLKKQIEELKKKQQDAQKKAQQAAQQNQQNQQNQQKNQQNKQQQQNSIRQAEQAAQNLENSARENKQEKLRQQASAARDELRSAREKLAQNASPQELQKHLDKAVEYLGKPEEKKDGKSQEKSSSGVDSGKPQEKKQKQTAPAAAAEEAKKKQDASSTREQQLKLLNDEAANMRKNLQRRHRSNQPARQVEKDW